MEKLTFNVSSGGRAAAPRLVVGRRPVDTAPPRAAAAPLGGGKGKPAGVVRERLDWDYVWIVAFTAALFLRPQDHIPALRSVHLAELTAIAGLAAMAVRRLAAGQTIARINTDVVAVMALGAVIVITIPFSFWPSGSLAVFSDVYVKIILIFALMVATLTTPKRLYQMLWLIVVSCGYISARGMFDYVRGVNLIEGNRLRGAVGGFMENPNDLATNLVTFLAPTLFIVFQDRRPVRRLLAGGIAVLMLAAIIATKSRAGFVGLGVMTLIVLIYMLRDRPSVIFATVFVGLIAIPVMPNAFWERMETILNPDAEQNGSREQRIQLFRQGMQVFQAHPLTGVGAGQFVNYDGPMMETRWRATHSVWLQVASELGIFGLITFGFLVWRAFASCFGARRALRPPRRKSDEPWTTLTADERRAVDITVKGMFAGLVGWNVGAFFASVAFNWTFYYVLAMAVAARDIAVSRRLAAGRRGDVRAGIVPASARLTPRRVAG